MAIYHLDLTALHVVCLQGSVMSPSSSAAAPLLHFFFSVHLFSTLLFSSRLFTFVLTLQPRSTPAVSAYLVCQER